MRSKRAGFPLRALGAVLGVALWLAPAGCASVTVRLPATVDAAPPREPRAFRAGAARVDITPPPGYPMGGYSRVGRFARGHWLRLYARALYFEDAEGRRLALVASDLWSLPRGLHDRVAELLASESFARRAAYRAPQRHEIVLAATHTHQSPAAYSTDRFFATFGAPAVGFDPRMFEMLAARIARAIADAAASARPARVSEARTRADGLVRNRSFAAFLRDPEAADLLARNGDLEACDEAGYDPRACRAVDPSVRVLRIEDAAAGDVFAGAVFLAAHPTTIAHESPLYSSDLFGALALESERSLAAAARRTPRETDDARAAAGASRSEHARAPVVAVFNGAQGDVSFRWRSQDRRNLLALLGRVAPFVEAALIRGGVTEARRLDGPALESRFELFSMAHRRVRDADGALRRTARAGVPGRGTMCGAEDGRSQAPGWISHEGKRGRFEWGAQGPKIGALDVVEIGGVVVPPFWFSRALAPVLAPEREVAMSFHRIGPLVLATLPGEFTTVMGMRVRDAVAGAAGVAADDVVTIGLAQSTAYYFATPEEYALQHYEGSSTMWGRHAGTFVAARAAKLADPRASDAYPRRASVRRYRPGMRRAFGTHRVDAAADTLDDSLRYVLGPDATWPRWCWSEPVVDLHSPRSLSARALRGNPNADSAVVAAARLTPRVVIETRASNGAAAPNAAGESGTTAGEAFAPWRALVRDGRGEDDEGLGIVALAGPPNGGEACWCAYWMAAAGAAAPAQYRFAVTRAGAEESCMEPADCSPAFALDAHPVASCPP